MQLDLFQLAKPERLAGVRDAAVQIGLSLRYANVLASVSVQRGLDKRVVHLLQKDHEYIQTAKASLTQHNKMKEDPCGFYLRNKGQRNFRTYGTLSALYSYASPLRVVQWVLADAQAALDIATFDREYDKNVRDGEEYYSVPFAERRFELREAAFRQDMRGNRVPEDALESLLGALKWDDCELSSPFGLPHTKMSVIESCYIFFTSARGRDFVTSWKEDEKRILLVQQFVSLYCNDPSVNPALVDMTLKDIHTEHFTRRCNEYPEDVFCRADGTPLKRSDRGPTTVEKLMGDFNTGNREKHDLF